MVYNFISNMYPKQSFFIVWARVRVNNFCKILKLHTIGTFHLLFFSFTL